MFGSWEQLEGFYVKVESAKKQLWVKCKLNILFKLACRYAVELLSDLRWILWYDRVDDPICTESIKGFFPLILLQVLHESMWIIQQFWRKLFIQSLLLIQVWMGFITCFAKTVPLKSHLFSKSKKHPSQLQSTYFQQIDFHFSISSYKVFNLRDALASMLTSSVTCEI